MSQQATIDTTGVLDQFQNELTTIWRRLPNKAFFFGLLVAWLALFHFLGNSIFGYIKTSSLFASMYESYNSPNPAAENDRHGNLIPLVVVGLLWWKRKELLNTLPRLWLPAIGIVLTGMLLHIIGFALQEPRISIVALFTGIYGLMGLAWGPQLLQRSFFPFWLFALCIPQGDTLQPLTFRLQLLVCKLVEFVSHNLLGIDIIRVGTQLFNPAGTYQYEVAAACSGIRSLVAIFLLGTIYGFVSFRQPWKRFLLMAMALPFAVLGNLVRMMFIIVAAHIWGQKAGDYVHDGGPAGILSLLPYVPAIIGVLLLGRWLEEKPESAAATTEPFSTSQKESAEKSVVDVEGKTLPAPK